MKKAFDEMHVVHVNAQVKTLIAARATLTAVLECVSQGQRLEVPVHGSKNCLLN